MRRAPTALLLAIVLSLGALPAAADAVDAHVAGTRGSSLPINGDLEWTANASASNQAANLSLGHTSLGHLTSICQRAAEIVGTGPSLDLIFAGFRASGPHLGKLTDPGWTSMGTGVTTGGDGNLYVSVVFCQGAGGTAPPPPAPEPQPDPPSPSPAPGPGPAPSTSSPTVASVPEPVSIDVVGLLSAVLTTSLDSLTIDDEGSDPIAAIGGRFLTRTALPTIV